MFNPNDLDELIKISQFISQRGLSPASAGNFSIRINEQTLCISASGKDKSQLTKKDFVVCDLNANLMEGEGKPSAETHLHGMIYALSPKTQCVLHTHSAAATVLSLLSQSHFLKFQGYEMQKTIEGFQSHEEPLTLMQFDNDQDIPALAQKLKQQWQSVKPAQGFLVKGHGLYSFGDTLFQAKRHMEGLEFLIQCELLKRQLSTQ